jgi:hypothetical protein
VLIAPCVVALGADVVTPFPVGLYFFAAMAADGLMKVAGRESLVGLAVVLVVWLLLMGWSAAFNSTVARARISKGQASP